MSVELIDVVVPFSLFVLEGYRGVLLAAVAAPYLSHAIDRVPSAQPAPRALEDRPPEHHTSLHEPPEHIARGLPAPSRPEVLELQRLALGYKRPLLAASTTQHLE